MADEEEKKEQTFAEKHKGKCLRCKGTGVCSECKGSGNWKSADGEEKVCASCDGTGKCYKCKGTGKANGGKGTKSKAVGFGKSLFGLGEKKGEGDEKENVKEKIFGVLIKGIIIIALISGVGFFILGPISILLGVGVFFLYLMFKKWPKFTTFVIILAVVIYLAWMFAYGGGGYYSTQAGTFGTELKEMFKPVTTQLGLTKMMLSGEYDPSEIWTSKVYKDTYAKEVGVEVSDVKPLRDYFTDLDNAVIIGTLKVLALPKSPDGTSRGITVDISASGGETLMSWTCVPAKLESQQRFFGRFQCVADRPFSVAAGKTTESKEANVKIELKKFETIAGKSTYVVDYNTLNLLYLEDQNPMTYYQLKPDQIASWQSKSPINLGMGILGEKDIIAANDDNNTAPYYLGITVRNTGTGSINKKISELVVEIPQGLFKEESDTVDVTGLIKKRGDNDFEPAGCPDKLGTLTLCKYELKLDRKNLCKSILDTDCKLGPGEYKTFYLKFKVPKDGFLNEANIKEFFALADITFDYEDITKVAIQVKKLQQFG